MIFFVGDSFAPRHLREAAIKRGLELSPSLGKAHLVFISQDTPIGDYGERILAPIKDLIAETREKTSGVLVLSSQVPPGFTRALRMPEIYHMAETLRIKDAAKRAFSPEQFIIGCRDFRETLPQVLLNYLDAFHCPIHQVTWEEAEFSKIAINMTLAAQVDNTNRLAEACKRLSIRWPVIADILRHDNRIGPDSYLVPGDWRDSKHLLRDAHALADLVPEAISRVAGRITVQSFRWGSSRLG